jgi:hypothetical protein
MHILTSCKIQFLLLFRVSSYEDHDIIHYIGCNKKPENDSHTSQKNQGPKKEKH